MSISATTHLDPVDKRKGEIPAVRPAARDVGIAWLLLLGIDAVVRLGGFARLCALVRRWRTRGHLAAPLRDQRAALLCAAVNRARVYYFMHARCLQSAAVANCLLRWHGIPAQLVIGVRRVPFTAHAWVEVDGRVVMNEQTSMLNVYTVIHRL